MKKQFTGIIAALGLLIFGHAHSLHAGTWNLATGGSWNVAGNWNPAGVPNSIGANATFNSAASGSNPAQTATRSITTDAAQTVGSINFNNDAVNAFNNSITTGTAGSLIFDEVGAGPATITVNSIAGAVGNNTISAPTVLNDDLVANVNNTTATSAAGAMNLTTAMTGPGGVTKNGDGLMTFGTGTKTYTGATVISGGRLRSSLTASPTATSSLTVNAGGQLTLISNGTYTFGAGPLNLNGNGAVSGPFALFPGAIRNDTNAAVVINNAVNLQSTASIHVQGAATGSTTLAGSVSGVGGLIAGANPHDANLGQLVLSGTNSYSGGSTARAGSLVAATASVNAFGTGDVTVESANLVFAGSQARLVLQTGATNAIDDSAYLFLAGGNVTNVADDGHADLGAGVNEVVRRLYLGGLVKIPGTYGSTFSSATYKFDEYFSGTGIVTVTVPEPASIMFVLLGTLGLAGRRRSR
jgi:autotransporter-associated beta strand protein